MSIRKITTLALFTTIALTIFMIEAAIPTIVPVPGIKLGLANIVTLYLINRYGAGDAAVVLLMRIILASIFAGQAVSFIYSICGGFLCLVVMVLINKLLMGKFVYITSIFGAIAHNTGQIFAAYFVLSMSGIFAYMPYLMISAVITGVFTGLVCHFLIKALKAAKWKEEQ